MIIRRGLSGTGVGSCRRCSISVRKTPSWGSKTSLESNGDICYKNAGYAKITATITDDTEALFTPCTYKIENVTVEEGEKLEPISEIVSFRGRFCEQAQKGETVTAQGKVEYVTDKRKDQTYYRIILGNQPADYMVLSQG
jgi:predicted nucleotidyltransferase